MITVITSSTPIARRSHTCNYCHAPIERVAIHIGERVELVGGGTVTVGGSAADAPRAAAPRAKAKRFKTRFRIKG